MKDIAHEIGFFFKPCQLLDPDSEVLSVKEIAEELDINFHGISRHMKSAGFVKKRTNKGVCFVVKRV